MEDFDDLYAVLRDAVFEMPNGDLQDPNVRAAVNRIQSLVESEYLVEVEPGKFKFTSAGIAHFISKFEPSGPLPSDAIWLNAKVRKCRRARTR